MIRHNLPGFLAGPMPIPDWPKHSEAWQKELNDWLKERIRVVFNLGPERPHKFASRYKIPERSFIRRDNGSSPILTPKKRYRGRNAKSKR
jgi:hypothetical protein